MEIRTLHDLSAAVRGRRRALRLSQAAVGERAGVSRTWVRDFEAGKSTVEIGRVLAVLEALGFTLSLRALDDPSSKDRSDAERGGPIRASVVDLDWLMGRRESGE